MPYTVQDYLAPWETVWPTPDGPWLVTLHWRERAGQVVCCGLLVEPRESLEPAPLTTTIIRSIPFRRLVRQARRERYDVTGGDVVDAVREGAAFRPGDEPGDSLVEEMQRTSAPWAEKPRGRPVKHAREHYREVAQAYSSALAAGNPPLMAVTTRYGIARPTASRWVAGAREEGFLPPTQRGRAHA
jgi:hypothetical protein